MAVNDEDYAIVIGINSYFPPIRKLRASEEDAGNFALWLIRDTGGGLNPKNIKTIVSVCSSDPCTVNNARPIRDEIDLALADFGVGKTDRVGRRLYFYFAGHGASPGFSQLALVMANAGPPLWFNLTINSLRDYLHNAAPFDELVFILDCCRDIQDMVPAGKTMFEAANVSERSPDVRELLIYASQYGSKAFEPVLPQSGEARGLLTQAIREGLENKLAHDSTGAITAASLADYLKKRVPELATDANLDQEPQIPEPDSRIVFYAPDPTLLSTVTVEVRAAPGLPGDIVLTDGDDEELARRTAAEVAATPWQLSLWTSRLFTLSHTASNREFTISTRRAKVEQGHIYEFK
jgi:uncharacterized caspase-like protein